MVEGEGLDEHYTSSVQVEGGTVEVVNHFIYLGSNISRDGKSQLKSASRAFGCLRKPYVKIEPFYCHKTGILSSGIVSSAVWS